MLTMIHANGARVDDGVFRVDRKFHSGMVAYAEAINAPLTTVHPMNQSGAEAMDTIEIPCRDLPYRVMTLKTDASFRPLDGQTDLLEQQIASSRLVYGMGMGFAAIARRRRVPYIMVEEYDLQTRLVVARTQVSSPLRKAVRSSRVAWHYARHLLPEARHAHSIHCNGYPIYDALRAANERRLLYLDSRMSADMVIGADALEARLGANPARRLKLLYSGRYEPLKGAADAVKVGIEALRRGLDVEMHCYGSGSQAAEMKQLIAGTPYADRIAVHDAVTYPELVALSRDFDVFVCCHVQGDPSCTYLESFGSGLPIVGYGNRMWRRLCEQSGAGRWSPLGDPAAVADSLQQIVADPALRATLSRKAREFALAHTFEREFSLRTDALNKVLAERPRSP